MIMPPKPIFRQSDTAMLSQGGKDCHSCLPEAEDKFLLDNMSMRALQLFFFDIISPK